MSLNPERPRVLMISKPVEPPWNDAAKNIVASQVRHASRFRYRVLTSPAGASAVSALGDHIEATPLYSGTGQFSPSLLQNARILVHGMRLRGESIFHYFFAPNPMTSFGGRLQKAATRVKTVHTICSTPATFDNIDPLLFADRLIVLSEHTRRQLLGAGVEEGTMRLVRPSIEPIAAPSPNRKREIRAAYGLRQDADVIIFPGDFEFSSGARIFAQSIPVLVDRQAEIQFVFACRAKTEAALGVRSNIIAELGHAGLSDHVMFLDSVDDMPALLGACDAVAFPCEDLYAKMDTPLVLLEAMSQRIPVVVANYGPLAELAETGGVASVPELDPLGLAETLGRLLDEKPLAAALGRRAEEVVREMFSPQRMAREIEDIYEEILSA